ncbi:hypothetical protein [Longispora urticae]
MSGADRRVPPVRDGVDWVLRAVVVAGLAVDAVVHLNLADGFDANRATISQGTLFRFQAAVAVAVAAAVLFTRWQIALLAALGVAGSAVAAVVVYRYVDVGAVGPLPDMYEPVWYAQKTISLLAEAAATVAAGALLVRGRRRRPHRPASV